MECNRDEASRSKEIAEKKFSEKDLAGAKKFALKAHNLYPGLEGISQMLAVLDVYIEAENKISGEPDWYRVLGVDPLAEDDTVRRQYRRLALMLHPDKNKSIGADGAFKLISDAWILLSDKARRLAYDQKRKIVRRLPTKGGDSSKPPPAPNGFYKFSNSSTPSHTKAPKGNSNHTSKMGSSSNPSSSHRSNPNTFWTVCHGCKVQYEYLRMYLYQNLLCPNCHEPFLAVETPPPFSNGHKIHKNNRYQQNSNHDGGPNTSDSNVQWGPFSKGGASTSQAATMVQQAYERVKREREEAQAAIKRAEALRRKRHASKRAGGPSSSGDVKKRQSMEEFIRNLANQKGVETSVVKSSNNSGQVKLSCTRVPTVIDDQFRLMVKARLVIKKKMAGFNSAPMAKSSFAVNAEKRDQSKGPTIPLYVEVPNSDFHDFDGCRTERSFAEGQVWAAYDCDDGMPRCYGAVKKILSVDPFMVKISWLSANISCELGSLNWVVSGFSKTCGEFRIGKRETSLFLSCFSHRVKWTKNIHGDVQVYPRKGDVWAIYRTWSPDWNELTTYEATHSYEIVGVDDFEEEVGFTVTPLVKVARFTSVFHRHLDPAKVRTIPIEEMNRFSHQIPSCLLTGQEASNAPRGCLELDPAATPLEFLQVIADAEEEEPTTGSEQHSVQELE